MGGGILNISRFCKILYPFLFVCCIATILYSLLPNKFSPEDIKLYRLSHYIDGIHKGEILTIIKSVFGWLDWYVYCIIIFYSIYYVSVYFSSKLNFNITVLLALFFACYFIGAYLVFGPADAHWYRYIWAFLLGHIIARQDKINKIFAFIVLMPFVLLILLENKFMILSYIIAICTLYIISKLGKVYTIKVNAPLLFVGTISYFYYLVHIRIAWNIMIYLNNKSLISWTLISLIISYFLSQCYVAILRKFDVRL